MNKDIPTLLSQLTLEEKASLCSGRDFWHLKGIERLNIPSIMVTDGPHGLRKQRTDSEMSNLEDSVPATCFPTASALAATWNRQLIEDIGVALGEECRQEQVGVLLGPGANIKRSPLCGRNFEYFSEDPYLSGEIAASFINGVQSQGIGTSLKHYAVNNQEHRRLTTDAIVDTRALHEIYLAGFERAVRQAQPWTVMCAYNKVNGTYCAEHTELMLDILKNTWGHEGLIVTDWGAMNERVDGLRVLVELEMPGAPNGNDQKIVKAVREGQLSEELLDKAVTRVLKLIFKAQETLATTYTYDQQAHHTLARQAAEEGAVLLKNDDHLLPLKQGQSIALLGRFAKHPRYQGAGSSLMNPSQLDNLHDALTSLIGAEHITYAPGYTAQADTPDQTLIEEATDIAKVADVVVLHVGLTDMFELEGLDRTHMKLPPGHEALIEAVSALHPKVIVVLSNGAPVEMPWAAHVSSILEGYLGGQAGGSALARLLTGDANPSGKLAETFPLCLEDNPSYPHFPGDDHHVTYCESLYVGYRYYDTAEQDVLFPFGHGLSYTQFTYSDLSVDKQEAQADETLTCRLRIKNTGTVAGKEIVQLYVSPASSSHFRPTKELKAFTKVSLAPGEETLIEWTLEERAFAYYDPQQAQWLVEAGTYTLLVGASSRDIRLQQEVTIHSSAKPSPVDRASLLAYYTLSRETSFTRQDFEALLGAPIQQFPPIQKGQYTLNTPLEDLRDSWAGRRLHDIAINEIKKMNKADSETPTSVFMERMVSEMPIRNLLMSGDVPLTRGQLEALVDLLNGRYMKGFIGLLRR